MDCEGSSLPDWPRLGPDEPWPVFKSPHLPPDTPAIDLLRFDFDSNLDSTANVWAVNYLVSWMVQNPHNWPVSVEDRSNARNVDPQYLTAAAKNYFHSLKRAHKRESDGVVGTGQQCDTEEVVGDEQHPVDDKKSALDMPRNTLRGRRLTVCHIQTTR